MRKLDLRRTITFMAFSAVFAMAVRVVVDTDLYWHLAAGRYILQAGIPLADPFSATMTGKAWVDIYWLAQIGLYSVFTWLGMNGLMLLVGLLVVGAFVFVWKQMSGGVWLRTGVLILTAVATSEVWTARPHLLTFLFAAILGYILYLYKWQKIDRLWLIPFLFVGWVNVHGGYIAGFMLLGALIVGEAVESGVRNSDWRIWVPHPEIETPRAELSWLAWRKLARITLVSAVVVLINPYTIGALELPFKTVGIGSLQNYIAEWASPNFHDILQQPMIWLLLLTLCCIGWSGRRLAIADALTLSVFAYISFLAQRNIGLFAIVCAPILTRHASALIEKARWGRRRMSRGLPIVNAIILIAISIVVGLKVLAVMQPSIRATAEGKVLPIGAADWIEQHRPIGAMFNAYNWGGYLMWRLGSNYPVFIDGRTDLYDDAFLNTYRAIVLAEAGAEALLERYQVNFIVAESNSVLMVYLAQSDRWCLAYHDQQAAIYTRRVGECLTTSNQSN